MDGRGGSPTRKGGLKDARVNAWPTALGFHLCANTLGFFIMRARNSSSLASREFPMPETKHVDASAGDVLLLVGTMKGAFILRSDKTRENWDIGGPYFPGRAIYAMAYDDRQKRKRLWAAVNSSYWGSYLSSSDDFGKTWTEPETYGVKFPEGTDASVKQIWQIAKGHPGEQDTLYCGVEPAALFKSTDAGTSWSLVNGLYDHPHRAQWMPGGGGLCLHTILPDPSNQNVCSWRSQPAAFIAPMMEAKTGSRETKECARNFCRPISAFRNGASAFIRSPVILQIRSESSCRIIGGFIAAITGAIHGTTSLMACLQILALQWKWIRTMPTASTLFRSSQTNFAARRKGRCASIAPEMMVNRGKR